MKAIKRSNPEVPDPLSVGPQENFPAAAESSKTREDQFDKIIDHVQDYAIIFLERDGTIATWNKGAQQIKGYAAEEIIGKNFRLFYTRDDKDAKLPERLLVEAEKNGKANHEGWRIRKDGTAFWGNVTITAIQDTNGKISGFLKVTRDLTEKKIAEDSLHSYTEELRLKNEALKKSEERYHKMVEEIESYAIILLDKDGTILDWNKGAEKVKGYTAKEILGKSFRLFYSKEDRECGLPEKILQQATENGQFTHEGWRIRKDGRRFWGFVSITALHNEEGEVFGFSKITRDLTDKKIAEDQISNFLEELKQKNRQLQESEDRYHRMIEEVQDYAIIFLNPEGEVQNWNSGARKIKGYTKDEIIGKSFRLFYTKEDQERDLPGRLLSEARQYGKTTHEGYRVRKDGTVFWASVVLTALHNDEGKMIGFSKLTRDLSDKKKSEEALDQKNQELERANSELSSFAYIAGHDLKEPLRKVKVFASRVVEEDVLSEKSRDYMDRILKGADRMQRLIDDLLSFSKLSGNSQLVSVDLNKILEDVQNDLEIVIYEKRAKIVHGKLPTLTGVPLQFHQLFLNLFSNSLKFAKPNEPPVITITSEITSGPSPEELMYPAKEYHTLKISDNGIGFEPEQADRIFDVFYRLHSREVVEGTGIGLAIVKKVVENHGGLIRTQAIPNAGATFFIYLPVQASV